MIISEKWTVEVDGIFKKENRERRKGAQRGESRKSCCQGVSTKDDQNSEVCEFE